MRASITVLTPKNQAEKNMKFMQNTLVGYTLKHKIIESKLLRHDCFYWILDITADDAVKIAKKCARGELLIKKFYRKLFKIIDKANKLSAKTGKGAEWLKRFLTKKLRKAYGNDNKEMIDNIENMNEGSFGEFIKVHDKVEMLELLDKELITFKRLD